MHVQCFGDATGSARVEESPSGTYTYLWSTGETTREINNLIAETYFVKVTDFSGCEVMQFITITQPPQLQSDNAVFHPVCYNQNSGYINLDVSGGVSPYRYIWSNNAESASNADLYSGTYRTTITDAHFCTLEKSFTLRQPAKIITTSEIEDVRGFGLSDGSVNITTAGGVHPYTYSWSGEAGFSGATEDIYNVESGTYSLAIHDSKGCAYDTAVFVPQPPPLSFTSEITNVFCNAFSDGAIDVVVSGGVPPYSYTWANSEILLNQNTANVKELAMGNYYLTITDFNGIELADSFYVDEPNSIVANISHTDAICFDSLNGNAFLTVSGGKSPYSYLWSNGTFSQNLLNVHAGTYDVEVVDANGCFRRVSTTIGQPDSIAINTRVRHITCKDHHNGQIFTDADGGIPPYRYSWSTGSTETFVEDLYVGSYSVTVTDAHDCPVSTTDEVEIPFNGCIEIPNAFTPNGDNYNDSWEIDNYYLYPDIEVLVMNKEGFPVFEDVGYNESWDGTFNGNAVASGTYYYIINLHNGDPIYKGIVTIIR